MSSASRPAYDEPASLRPAHAGTDDRQSDAWSAFAAATSRDAFCRAWLALQCSMVPQANAALLLLREDAGEAFVPAATWPDARRDLSYLAAAAESALKERRGLVVGPAGAGHNRVAPGTVHVAYPFETGGELHGVVVLDLAARPEGELQAALRQLMWGAGWLEALLHRSRRTGEARALARAGIALDLVQLAQERATLDEAALAIVNELATRLGALRVSLGMTEGGRTRLRAISRTAWFDRHSQLAQSIEDAMDEAVDQEGIACHAEAVDGRAVRRGTLTMAQRDLAARGGAGRVLSVPLVSGGRPVGAVTLEFGGRGAIDEETLVLCEAACELLGPPLAAKREEEHWFTGRAARLLAGWRDRVLGPRSPAVKLGVFALVAAALFLAFADGEFRVTARTVIEGETQRAVVAPFDAYVTRAHVRAGDTVAKGQVLAELDDRELLLERVRWEAELRQAEQRHREALARRDRAAVRVLAAQLAQAGAQLALTEERLARARLVAPYDGVVVSGDLSQVLGAPVERGTVLFEIAPLDAYRVILHVDERDVGYVAPGQRGELALSGLAGASPPFVLERATSVSTPQDGGNFFRAEARLEATSPRLRPGMEGVGKISIGERRLVWIWTRRLVDWLRISAWSLMP